MDEIQQAVQEDGSLHFSSGYIGFISWNAGDKEIVLDGHFTVEQLEFIVAHIKSNE